MSEIAIGIGQAGRHILPVLRAGWTWWIGELTSLLPESVQGALKGLRRRLVLTVDGATARLAWEFGDRREAVGLIDLMAAEPAEIRTLLAPFIGPDDVLPSTVLRLDAAAALCVPMVLPLAARANLAQVVNFEFERFAPFKREDTYFSHRIIGQDATAGRLNLELVIVPRYAVDDLLAAVRRLGLPVGSVEVSGKRLQVPLDDVAGSRLPLDRAFRIGAAVLAATAALLAMFAVAVPVFQARDRAAQLATEVAEVRRKAEAAQQLRKNIDAVIEDRRVLVARKQDTPTVTELLGSLTHLLPDDTWLSELQVTGETVQISGFANSATALLGVLDQAELLSNAAFRSSVVRDNDAARERFDISAQIRSRAAAQKPAAASANLQKTKR